VLSSDEGDVEVVSLDDSASFVAFSEASPQEVNINIPEASVRDNNFFIFIRLIFC
jgi:hypothetical protein